MKTVSRTLTILAFLGASLAVGCSGSSDSGDAASGDDDGNGVDDPTAGDGDSDRDSTGDGDGNRSGDGDGDQPGDGDGDQPGDGDGDQLGDGDGDQPGDGDGTGGTSGDGDGDDERPVCLGEDCCGPTPDPQFEPCSAGWSCVAQQWLCDAESDCPSASRGPNLGCIGVIANAVNPETGTCCEYPDPCSVPHDWASCDLSIQPAN